MSKTPFSLSRITINTYELMAHLTERICRIGLNGSGKLLSQHDFASLVAGSTEVRLSGLTIMPCFLTRSLAGRGRSDKFRRGVGGTICCPVCAMYQSTWSLDDEEIGSVDVGMVEARTAAYVGGYIIKGKTTRDDSRLRGKAPEFASQSLRPGLGAFAIDALASVILNDKRSLLDIPTYVEFGGQKYPLGRYLTARLRNRLGIDDATARAIRVTYAKEKMSELREHSTINSVSLKEAYQSLHSQKILNWKSKRKILKRRDTL